MRHATPAPSEAPEPAPKLPFTMVVTLRSGTSIEVLVVWFKVVRNRGGGVHHIEWLDAKGVPGDSLVFVDYSEVVAVIARRPPDDRQVTIGAKMLDAAVLALDTAADVLATHEDQRVVEPLRTLAAQLEQLS